MDRTHAVACIEPLLRKGEFFREAVFALRANANMGWNEAIAEGVVLDAAAQMEPEESLVDRHIRVAFACLLLDGEAHIGLSQLFPDEFRRQVEQRREEALSSADSDE